MAPKSSQGCSGIHCLSSISEENHLPSATEVSHFVFLSRKSYIEGPEREAAARVSGNTMTAARQHYQSPLENAFTQAHACANT